MSGWIFDGREKIRLSIIREADQRKRFKKIMPQYNKYLSYWREKLEEAYGNCAVQSSEVPDWLQYHVKIHKGDD